MGNVPSNDTQPLVQVLRKLLKSRDLKVGRKTLESFFEEIDSFAPWFLPTGHLNLPSWEKLGRDLSLAEREGGASVFARPLWEMIYACLKSEGGCREGSQELIKVRRAFKQAQSGSSREGSVKGDKDIKEEDGAQASESSDSENEEGLDNDETKEPRCQEDRPLDKESQGSFPALRRELRSAQLGLRRSRELLSAPWREREAKPSAPPWELFPEAIPRHEAAAWELPPLSPEQKVMHGPPFSAQSRPPSYAPPPAGRYFYRRLWQGGRLSHEVHPPPGIDSGPYGIFPVQVAVGQGRNAWEPFEIKQIRKLKNAVTTFGPTAPYTIAMLENLSSGPLTPADWIQLAKVCLPSGSYLDWRAWYTEFSAEQAEKNAGRGNGSWGFSLAA
ncbi:endogenous retrovirus group K member 113 Gag polyprotein-like [Cavia porcellus]|uniref:endogenous retrovirus group K member 113 Gag polyprotein-like n=1 Tax=Cavia porcellus TaxID=10141 RepID=UPI002FE2C43B